MNRMGVRFGAVAGLHQRRHLCRIRAEKDAAASFICAIPRHKSRGAVGDTTGFAEIQQSHSLM